MPRRTETPRGLPSAATTQTSPGIPARASTLAPPRGGDDVFRAEPVAREGGPVAPSGSRTRRAEFGTLRTP